MRNAFMRQPPPTTRRSRSWIVVSTARTSCAPASRPGVSSTVSSWRTEPARVVLLEQPLGLVDPGEGGARPGDPVAERDPGVQGLVTERRSLHLLEVAQMPLEQAAVGLELRLAGFRRCGPGEEELQQEDRRSAGRIVLDVLEPRAQRSQAERRDPEERLVRPAALLDLAALGQTLV